MSYEKLDGPALQGSVSVTTGAVVELKVGANPLEERKVITVQPIDGKIYVYFGNEDTVPSVSYVQNDGFVHFKPAKDSYEATASQRLYILATSGTVDVRYVERA